MKRLPLFLALLAILAAPALAQRYERHETTTVIVGDQVEVYEEKEVIDEPAFPTFAKADQDGNGYLDRQEARDVGLLEFRQFDTDGDGRIQQSEYEAIPVQPESAADSSPGPGEHSPPEP
ncbi:MAG: hypothetical protein R3310_12155 [Candidatus Competibacteraceae bacterium]|nr:hypothetical protein [Candidatus Competibacteraceae bacterium]